MERIKFRAWYKEAKMMLTVSTISFSGGDLDTYEMQGDWLNFDQIQKAIYGK